jgi:hypothetical protein
MSGSRESRRNENMNFKDLISRLTGSGDSEAASYIIPVFLLLGAVVVFYIVMLIVKARKRSGPASLESIPYIDVTSLQKRGLLSAEETRRVRESLSKQVARKQGPTSLAAMQGELGLMADPEVQRLEMLAQQKAQERAAGVTGESSPGGGQPRSPQRHPVFWQEEEPDGPPTTDIQLPEEVLKMAELGLITPEELENIRERTRRKKREISGD